MRQCWRDLAFIHGRVEPSELQRHLPPDWRPDVFDGSAWLGFVPFLMDRVRLGPLPPIPGTARFWETNLRTYVRLPDDSEAVLFFSLDATNRAAVEIARRWFGLPYFNGQLVIRDDPPQSKFWIGSRHDRRLAPMNYMLWADLPARIDPAAPGSLTHFLVERYRLAVPRANGEIVLGEVAHPPYQVGELRIRQFDDDRITTSNGFPPIQWEHFLYSPGVDVRIGAPARVRIR